MDTGGYPIFNGNPIEAISYFKAISQQLDHSKVICEACGNVNPEQIFNIIEAKVVDEFGNFSDKRKISPEKWYEYYLEKVRPSHAEEVKEVPKNSFKLPSIFKQFSIFVTRDVLSKIADKQYMLVNLLEAPLLALILAYVIRYKDVATGDYLFLNNDNIPAYLLMSIIVALFLGLSISAEEIIKDRKLRDREKFLHLSKGSYLMSKVAILFTLSSLQILVFVLIGNAILELHNMTLSFWIVLFSTATFANILGLNIGSAFKSAITVYILIPVVLIPQMILSGLLFSFDKLNNSITTEGKVPLIGDSMTSRWALEALAVDLFKNNAYQYPIFESESAKRNANYKSSYWSKEIKNKVNFVANNFLSEEEDVQAQVNDALLTLRNEITAEQFKGKFAGQNIDSIFYIDNINPRALLAMHTYVRDLEAYYGQIGVAAQNKMDDIIMLLENSDKYDYNATLYKKLYYNENLATLVRNSNTEQRIVEKDNVFIRRVDPIFQLPNHNRHPLDYRTHMFAPVKYFLGMKFDTFWFNVSVIWLMTIILYILLYFDVLERLVNIRWFRK